jgi:hypothetical protein
MCPVSPAQGSLVNGAGVGVGCGAAGGVRSVGALPLAPQAAALSDASRAFLRRQESWDLAPASPEVPSWSKGTKGTKGT